MLRTIDVTVSGDADIDRLLSEIVPELERLGGSVTQVESTDPTMGLSGREIAITMIVSFAASVAANLLDESVEKALKDLKVQTNSIISFSIDDRSTTKR